MPISRPEKYPLVATTPGSNYAEPPSGVALGGWNVGAIFPSSDANYLGDHWSKWIKYNSEQAIAGPDALDVAVAQRVSAVSLDFDLGSGLVLAPNASGAVYMVFGCRVTFDNADVLYSGGNALTFTPNTTNYVHVRPQPDLSGPLPAYSVGEILVSTNAVEAGYLPVRSFVANGSDLISTTELATVGYSFTTKCTFTDLNAVDLTITDLLTFGRAQGLGVSGSHTLVLSPPASAHRALYSVGSSSAELVRLEQAGSGDGLYVSSSAGTAFRAVGSNTAGVYAIRVEAGTSGHGINIAQGSTNSIGMLVSGGTSQQRGIDVTGGSGSSNSQAIRGTGSHADAVAIHGRTSTSASTVAAGVQGEGRGNGTIGVHALHTGNGYALLVEGDSSAPQYPQARFVPANADPTASNITGDFLMGVQNQFRYAVSGFGYKPIMSIPGRGSAVLGIGAQVYNTSVNYGASLTTVCTANCLASEGNGFFSVAAGNFVRIRFTADVRTGVAANDYANVQIQDFTTGVAVPIATWSGAGTAANNGFALYASTDWQRAIVAECTYSPLADGDLIIRVQMSRVTNNQFVRNGRVEVIGAF